MGKSATKMTISIDPHREIHHFDGYCYKNGEISNREIQNGEISKILAIYLSAGNSNIFAGTPESI